MSLSKRLIAGAGAAAAGPAFNILTWTGTGGTRSFTGLGFQPDWVVIRRRNSSNSFTGDTFHYNSISGANIRYRMSATHLPNDETGDYLSSFDSDGFTVYDRHNTSGETFVAWCWRFNGGTTTSNTNCTNTSITQVNPDFPWSLVTTSSNLTGDGLLGHGLSETPKLYITKSTSHSEVTYGYTTQYDGSWDGFAFNSGTKFDSGFSGISSTCIDNVANRTWMHWVFNDSDISKVGTYTGTGSSGLSVTTGFPVNFVLLRGITDGIITIIDSVRGGTKRVYWGYTNVESDSSTHEISFGSTGFTINGTSSIVNSNGRKYMYLAFSINV